MISRPRSEGQFTQDPSHSKVVHNLLFQGMGGWGVGWDKESQLPREKKKKKSYKGSLPLESWIWSFKASNSIF